MLSRGDVSNGSKKCLLRDLTSYHKVVRGITRLQNIVRKQWMYQCGVSPVVLKLWFLDQLTFLVAVTKYLTEITYGRKDIFLMVLEGAVQRSLDPMYLDRTSWWWECVV
jgi:hypothetical protein